MDNADLAELMTKDREIDMAELDKAWTAVNPETCLHRQDCAWIALRQTWHLLFCQTHSSDHVARETRPIVLLAIPALSIG
jgi:hypothetical protein